MQSVLTSKNVSWTNVNQPEPEELAALVREINLLPLDAQFVAQNYHRAEITVRSQYLLVLIHVPIFNRETRITTGVPLYLIVQSDRLYTLTYKNVIVLDKLVQDFTNSPDLQAEYFNDGALGLALFIIDAMYRSAFNKLERLHKHINITEDAVFQGNERKMVEEIAVLARDVMDFRKIIRPQQKLFTIVPVHPWFTSELTTQWHRLNSQVAKLWDILESLSESAMELRRTNTSLLHFKESQLLQMLTYYSILSIPFYLLLTPFTPQSTAGLDPYVYWGGLSLLGLALVMIFLRFKGKRVL